MGVFDDRSPVGSRSDYPVMVPDAHAIGMIGVIRSLGQAGYPVYACASDSTALGLKSRMALQGHIYPAFESEDFLPWLRAFIAAQGIRAIIHSEGFLLAIRDAFDEFSHLLLVPKNKQLVYDCLSKSAVLMRLMDDPLASQNLPPSLICEKGSPVPTPEEVAALGLPLFIKADGTDDLSGHQNLVRRVDDPTAACAMVAQLMNRYRRVIVQGFVPGLGTGAYVLMHQGKIVQEFMNRCLHEIPHTGGFCSLRDSWWHESMMQDARAKIVHLGWDGVAMLEYRWDEASQRFWFVELNARFWAALHVALYAGVDFPAMLVDIARGESVRRVDSAPLGLQVRYTIPFEVDYVASRLRDKQLPLPRRLASVAGWFLRFLSPTIRADLLYPGDRALYFRQWWRYLHALSRK